jgi:hypothetical protein
MAKDVFLNSSLKTKTFCFYFRIEIVFGHWLVEIWRGDYSFNGDI